MKIIFYLVFGERISQIYTYFLFSSFPSLLLPWATPIDKMYHLWRSSSANVQHAVEAQQLPTCGLRSERCRHHGSEPLPLSVSPISPDLRWKRRGGGHIRYFTVLLSKNIILIGKRVLWQIHAFLQCPLGEYQFLLRVSKRWRRNVMFRSQFCLTLSIQSSNTRPKSVHVLVLCISTSAQNPFGTWFFLHISPN